MKTTFAAAMSATFLAIPAVAEEPQVQSPSPIIYLADNLDEVDGLGWCIDTLGRGFSEQIQAHSCKPQGGDTQFRYDTDTGALQSVEFDGKCMTLSAPESDTVPFGLLDCEPGTDSQSFEYDALSKEFRLTTDPSQCVVVAEDSRTAGPFMSRDLTVKPCATVDASLKRWVIRN
ncbi:RICIN domain-containing protein [Tateyamaria omphalii]|uniref:ricin-type beta-trefoil lectin domain protein n=1 Tax=Tateyamaria omphalii TaxID=299262 RepID=UPI001C99A355|nr:ricin-type beta-trefoil lectin domain protein [Tateyamaria omphalii]MBY5933951.1 RICIN domain-containing protein [Tateyamaria omphalii]